MSHRRIVIFDELSHRRNGFRRNVMEALQVILPSFRSTNFKANRIKSVLYEIIHADQKVLYLGKHKTHL